MFFLFHLVQAFETKPTYNLNRRNKEDCRISTADICFCVWKKDKRNKYKNIFILPPLSGITSFFLHRKHSKFTIHCFLVFYTYMTTQLENAQGYRFHISNRNASANFSPGYKKMGNIEKRSTKHKTISTPPPCKSVKPFDAILSCFFRYNFIR